MVDRGGCPPDVKVLNLSAHESVSKNDSLELSKDLRKHILRLKGQFITESGDVVDYKSLKNSDLFQQYKTAASQLRSSDISSLNEGERKAFFINIYNALTIHGLVDFNVLPNSVLAVQQFWKTTAYDISGHVFTLDDIEHGILRGNRPHPSSKTPPFSETDTRRCFALKAVDPRIHFALNCGAKSCPAINVYSALTLDTALDAATSSFCEQEVICLPKCEEIIISRLFQWYRVDFGSNDVEAIRWVLPYLSEKKRATLNTLLVTLEERGGVDIAYSEYNWSLNDAGGKINHTYAKDLPEAPVL